MPAVAELRIHRPDVHVAWAVEEAYAELVALHPGVDEVLAVGLRALRGNVLDLARWRRLAAARKALGSGQWDYVIDSQGLLKSALVARAARAASFGMDRASARERIAARFYDVKIAVPRALHAVERNRRLVGEIFGYAPQGEADYGLATVAQPPAWAPSSPYAVLLHAASRAEKRWPEERWMALGTMLAQSGYTSVLCGGNAREREAAARLAAAIPGAVAAPAMGLAQAAEMLGHAALVAGVDTGLTHLAVALGRPTVGIYCATRPELTGLHGRDGVNLGGPGRAPTVESVAAALGYAEPVTAAPGAA
jgi:heptosyltransferase-1